MAQREYPGLEVHEDMRVKQLSWVGQIVMYALLGVFLAAGLLGVFGMGPVSSTEARDGGLVVRYERFQRATRPARIGIDLDARDGTAVLTVDRRLFDEWRLESVAPQPRSVSVHAGAVTYTFRATGRAHVVLYATPEQMGGSTLRMRSNSDAVMLRTFVYP